MMAIDSLHVAVHLVVPSGVSFCWLLLCRRACSAGANSAHRAPHFALPPAQPSTMQASCRERARPAAVAAFVGALAARAAVPPGRQRPERERRAKAEGKIKGRGTWPLQNLVCTWGWRGTRHWVVACRECTQYRTGIGETTCCTRWTMPALDGATP